MASALRRRAVAAVVATIRPISSVATPILPASAATKATALRLSSAAASIRSGPTPIAARLRGTHSSAIPEPVEALIRRLEIDIDNKISALRVELQAGSAEACNKIQHGIRDGLHELQEAHLKAYDSLLQGLSRQDVMIGNLADSIAAEGRRSVHRAATSSAESARSVARAGQVSWRVVVTVVGAAGAGAFSTAQLLRADTTTSQTHVADGVVRARTAELEERLTSRLEETIDKGVTLALAKEARRRTLAEEEALHAFTARMDDAVKGLDDRVNRAVEMALANQAATGKKDNKSGQGGGGGGPKTA